MMPKPQLGVCYYPEHWPEEQWADDASQMRAHGITLVRIGEFGWSRIEPRSGNFCWEWLDRAIEVLADAGLNIILGTPTACPPHWLVQACPDILPVGIDGQVRGFGSRRHYSFSSDRYRQESRRITTALAERYGQHSAIVGWQLDNEYGCHETTLCYSDNALAAFRGWLKTRYGTVTALNEAWGNVFWSQEYNAFENVGLPVAVTETNPAHRLAFHRFSSDQVRAFSDEQAAIIRAHCRADAFLTHNFMGDFVDFDHYAVMQSLDVASWDSYPLGFLDQSTREEPVKQAYRRSGHPDWAAFHHDLYRGVGNGRFAVMEQQPGAVNWAPNNAQPAPGMVRLWSFEAIAHGAEFVSWFRWRQAPFAQEQMHAGILRCDNQPAMASAEVRQLSEELATLNVDGTRPAKIALIFDYTASWIVDIQPHSAGYNALTVAMAYYSAARCLGLDVDIIPIDAPVASYDLIMLPCLPIVSDVLATRLADSNAQLLIGPRAGSKTKDYAVCPPLPPGPLRQLIDLKVISVDAIRDSVRISIDEHRYAHSWLEHIESPLTPELESADRRAILYRNGRCRYLTAGVCENTLRQIVAACCADAGIEVTVLPEGLRLRRHGGLRFAFNYSDSPQTLPTDAQPLIGAKTLAPFDVAVWQDS